MLSLERYSVKPHPIMEEALPAEEPLLSPALSAWTHWRSPLAVAAEEGDEDTLVRLLGEQGIEADVRDYDQQTPLWLAAEAGHESIVSILLQRSDVVPDAKARYGQTALSAAAANGHPEIVRLLLARPEVDANSRDRHG